VELPPSNIETNSSTIHSLLLGGGIVTGHR
jgi:hypothetical protein